MDAITAQTVTKTYRVGVGRARIREMMPWPADRALQRLFPKWWARNTFNALEDVSLSIPTASSTGLVGHNGAGKTTLLKVIAGVTAPTKGSVATRGRIAALIDALVGFNAELTGVENVFLLASMHGFARKKVVPRLDRILDFAEIGEMADTPVKRYSTGMSARLGFAIITALEPEILLVDEILAVGDASFQRKCIQWLDEYRSGGGTLLFVSHNLALVRNMTQRVIWLDHGQVVGDGPTAQVLAEYAQAMEHREFSRHTRKRREVRKAVLTAGGMNRWGAGGARVDEVHFEERSEGGDLAVSISFEAEVNEHAVFCVGFVDEGGREIGATASPPVMLTGRPGMVRCTISPFPFRSGIYFPVVAIMSPEGLVRDRWKLDRAVVVDGNSQHLADFGPVDIAADWSEAGARSSGSGEPS